MPSSVAVIGAGAAGLVSARHLLKCGLRPCIFEACANGNGGNSQVVGGCWNSQNSKAYKMWDNLSPNLSKYTCVFSDHLWEADSPTFPTQHALNQYLNDYSTKYLMSDDNCNFRMGCTVTNVKRTGEGPDGGSQSFAQPFQVEWTDQEDGNSYTEVFDGVIVATGFFATPYIPFVGDKTKIVHSSQYRSPTQFANQTVAVIGSSFSALEIAADVRKQAQRVISVLPRIPYVIPRYVPAGGDISSAYAPLDTVLYQRRQSAPQAPHKVGEIPPEDCERKHAFLRGLVGTHKQQESSPLGFPTDTTTPPLVAISDDYLNLVVDGNIEVVKGKVQETTVQTDKNKVSITLQDGDQTTLTDIDQVIACTGYRTKLNFLDSDILQKLEYNEEDSHAPLTLCNEAFHPTIPGLGFVGMYRGPYFGIMELQARLLANMMSGKVMPTSEYIEQALEDSKTIRKQTTANKPQFPRYDYEGFMDQLAQPLGLVPQGEYGDKGCMVSPVFYNNDGDSDDDSKQQWKQAIEQELTVGHSANMAHVALSALIGKWQFKRSIVHFNAPNQPPQRITGVIDFSLIPPSKKGGAANDDDNKNANADEDWNSAVLYNENGIFHLPNGKDMDVFRQYEYEAKPDGILEIYFVEGGKRAHLFLSLKFVQQRTNEAKDNKYWVATSDHLCIKDLYKGTFQIALEGLSANHITMTYRVKGPNKDYESITDLRPLA